MKIFLCFGLVIFLATPIFGQVVRPAPEFTWQSINGSSRTLSSLAKQPVILIVAPSASSGAFKKQLKQLHRLYRQYAGREAVFIAAFTEKPGVVKSEIPFLYADNPMDVAANYGLPNSRFKLAIIGPDRNVDLITENVISGERVRDVIDNSSSRQAVRRK